MTTNAPHWQQPTPRQATGAAPKKRHRVFWGVFLAMQGVFLAWVISAATTVAGPGEDCGSLSHSDCVAAHEAGGTIGLAVIIALWAVTNIIVGGTYAIYRLTRRQ